MLLAIRFKEKDVVRKEDGLIVVKINHYGQYVEGVILFTVKGTTASDFGRYSAISGESILIDTEGRIESDEEFKFFDRPEF